MVEQLHKLPDVRLMSRTAATGFYDHHVVALSETVPRKHPGRRGSATGSYERHVILATGAIDAAADLCQ